MEQDYENRIEQLGIHLPLPPQPVATYLPAQRAGDLLFVSGAGPLVDGKALHIGKLGADVTLQQGYDAARTTGLNLLAALKAEIGSLNELKQIIKLVGFVNATTDFHHHPQVINGASELMIEIFGDAGTHARAAVGVTSLPLNWCVEIEMIAQVKN